MATQMKYLNQKCVYVVFITLIIIIFQSSAAVQAWSSERFELFDKEERAWLSEHPTIRIGVGIAFHPYQWVEKENGIDAFKGVVSEYVKLLEKRLNIQMKVSYGISFKQALALGRKKEIDLFPCLAQTPEREEFLIFTKPYISYPSVIIAREDAPFIGGLDDLRGRRLATVKHLVVYSKLKADYASLDLSFIETQGIKENLEAVSTGRADACITDLGTASYYIQKLRIPNLKVAAPTDWDRINLAMGIRDDWPILKSIVQKALTSITREEKDAITDRWVRLQYKPGIDVERILHYAFWIGGTVALCLLVFFLWNQSLQREIDRRKLAETEQEKLILELKLALDEVKKLSGLLPICAKCKKVRDDKGYWSELETYIRQHTDANITHGLCPECMDAMYRGQEWYERGKQKGKF